MIFKNVVSPFLVCANRITPRLWKVENSLQTLHILGIGSFIGDILQQIHQLNAIMATESKKSITNTKNILQLTNLENSPQLKLPNRPVSSLKIAPLHCSFKLAFFPFYT